jgi:hypothetical protein
VASRKSDYVRSDEIADMIVPVAWLPDLFKVDATTIRRWIKKDDIRTFPNPLSDDPKERAIRWGDLPLSANTPRWRRKNAR